MSCDYAYAELGLAPGASEAEVKAAWRRLVSQWHPDRNSRSSAVDRMQRINLAFETIREAGFGRTLPEVDEPQEDDDTEADVARRVISRKVCLTLEEAAAGCTKVLRGKVSDPCAACVGAGQIKVDGACKACEGSGQVRRRSWYGMFSSLAECEACEGDGSQTSPCLDCNGAGKVNETKYSTTVRIPHGVRDGDVLHVDARRVRAGQAPGDFELRVELARHAFLVLDDDGTVRCEMPVNGFLWVANRAIEVPTLAGLQRLALSRGTLSYRLVGQGFPVERRGPRGDQIVTIVPTFPDDFTADQDILLDQLVATASADPRLKAWSRTVRAGERASATAES